MNRFTKFHIIIPPKYVEENPECLIRAAQGDIRAFEWLYTHYCQRLYEYVQVLTADSYLAEDLVQEVFAKIWARKEKLGNILNFTAYLHTTAKNHLISVYRKKQRERRYRQQALYLNQSYTEAHLLIKKEEGALVSKAILSLSRRQQLVYRLVKQEGWSRQEVGSALGISPFTVRNTIKRAQEVLREKIEEMVE